ncbi:MAG: polyprenyl synthetase family protein, partial [Euryarchaeota archaeon]|nr:polyprenyl synthetase family protein [Euryarchaeota archaeon]
KEIIMITMNFENLLDQYTKLIDSTLEPYLDEMILSAKLYHPFIQEIYENIKEFVMRKGKRLASCSTLLTYKGYTKKVDEKILRACIGIELYRHGILVHDDLVDEDEYRRGGKSFHEIFSELCSKRYRESKRFGDSISVFAGNILYASALKALADAGFDQNTTRKVIELLNNDYCNVNESQILDLLFEFKEPDVEEWYSMASKRASSLFRATILTGATLANAPEKDISILEKCALHIGYSFDIQDDIIGTFASEEQYGRPTSGDILLAKKPLHMVYTYQLASSNLVKKMREILGKETSEDIERIKQIIRESGALDKAKQESKMHANKAIKLIEETILDKETKEFFTGFINFVSQSLDWYK